MVLVVEEIRRHLGATRFGRRDLVEPLLPDLLEQVALGDNDLAIRALTRPTSSS